MWNFLRRNLSGHSSAAKQRHRAARVLRLETLDARRVFASDYQNPGQQFDVNNDTYVDQEDIRLSEARMATLGEGRLPTIRDHHLIPFYDVNGDGTFNRADVNALRIHIDQGRPIASLKLASDSGNPLDRVTNHVGIVGRIMNFQDRTRVFAQIDSGSNRAPVEVTRLIGRDGAFQFSIHDLHRISGRLLQDGSQVMRIQAYDRMGRTLGAVDYSFTIDRTGPQAFNLKGSVFEPPIGTAPSTWVVGWEQKNGRSYDLKITTDAAGKNTVFYRRDVTEHNAARNVITGLAAGTYYVWVTGFDESGNRTQATGDGQKVVWDPTFNPPPAPAPPVTPPPPPAVIPPVTPTISSPPTTYGGELAIQVADMTGISPGREYYSRWHVAWKRDTEPADSILTVRVARDAQGAEVVWDTFAKISDGGVDLSHLAAGTYYVTVGRRLPGGDQIIVEGRRVEWHAVNPTTWPTNPISSIDLHLNVADIRRIGEKARKDDEWLVSWNSFALDRDDDLRIRAARDPQGTDIAFDSRHGSFSSLTLSHLAPGTYYLFVDQLPGGRLEDAVRLIDGVRVDWLPSRPGEFSIETKPQFAHGNQISVAWQTATNAVRYEVNLRRDISDYNPGFVTGVYIPYEFGPYGPYAHYHGLIKKVDVTEAAFTFDDLAEGEYVVDVIAYDAKGSRTYSANHVRFYVDADGVINTKEITGGVGQEGDFYFEVPTDNQIVKRVRFEFYSDADLTANSLITTSMSNYRLETTISRSALEPYEHVYIRAVLLDVDGNSFALEDVLAIDPATFKSYPGKQSGFRSFILRTPE